MYKRQGDAGQLLLIGVDVLNGGEHSINGTDIDDGTAFTGGCHPFPNALAGEKRSHQIGIDNLSKHLLGKILKRTGHLRRGAGLRINADVYKRQCLYME